MIYPDQADEEQAVNEPGWTGGWRAAALVTALAALANPGSLPGQEATGGAWERADPVHSTLELTGYTGVLLPMSVLGSLDETQQADLSTKPAFAAGLDVWFGGGFGLGIMGGIASPDLTLTTADPEGGPADVAELGTVDYLHGEALLLWRPRISGSAAVLLPHVGAGAGIRKLGFDADSGFEDTTDAVLVLAAGAQVRVSDRIHIRLDVRDLMSSFEGGPFESSDTQHDLFVHVGLGIGL